MGGMGRETGEGFRREGTCVSSLIQAEVWRKPAQYHKAIILKKKKKKGLDSKHPREVMSFGMLKRTGSTSNIIILDLSAHDTGTFS